MPKIEHAILAGGCFWGVEHLFQKQPGVISAVSGYVGGVTPQPGYSEVCSGLTGHAEAVQIEFDSEIISYKEILHFFWEIHNPTTLNRQGPDIGTQYRSAIFTTTPEQVQVAEESKAWAQQFFDRPIVTEIVEAAEFFPAEDYHQDYFEKNGGHGCHFRRPIGR